MSLPLFRHHLHLLGQHHLRLRASENVHHVDVGWRYQGGQRTEEVALRVFLSGPKRREGPGLAPSHLEGLKVDVISIPVERHCDHTTDPERVSSRPLQGGISIGAKHAGAGTLGVLVYRGKDPCILTVDHLAPKGAEIHQPAPTDDLCHRRIGEVVEWDEQLTAALIRLDPPKDALEKKKGIAKLLAPKEQGRKPVGTVWGLPRLRRVATVEECHEFWLARTPILKSGRTTGVTKAVLDGIAPDGVMTLVPPDHHQEISCGGDSGSIWCTEDGVALGIHYAGSLPGASPLALARPVALVMEKWGLSLSQGASK